MIYFIKPCDAKGPIKIGHSDQPGTRLINFSSGCPFPLELIAVIPGERVHARHVHFLFRHSRLHAEWFAPTNDLMEWLRPHLFERPLVAKIGNLPGREVHDDPGPVSVREAHNASRTIARLRSGLL